MESDAEDTKSQVIENQETTTPHKHKKKKKKKEVPPVQATIQVFQDNPERTPPLVGYFPSGFDPTKNPDPRSTKVGVFRHRDKARRLQLVVSPSGSKVDFVGTSYSGEAEAGQQHCNYALGVLDKASQTLKIVPIASNKIFRLEPKVRGFDFSDKEPANSVAGDFSAQQKAVKHIELHNLYGTKKSIRENKKMHSLKQEQDPDSQKDLDAQIKQIVVNKEALEVTEEGHVSRNSPPFNASATTPQEAYPLDKIIATGEWNFLQDIYELLQGGADVSGDAFPTFVCNRIYKLQEIEDEDEKYKLSCIFSYITHLIKFKDQHSMDGVSSAKRHRIPSILRHKFSTMFDSDSKKLSTEKNDLLISYVLVLTLFVDEFQTELSDIAKDLRMSSLTLRVRYEHLGCKLSRKNSLWLATLHVPLQFPKLRPKRRNR